MFGTLAPLVTDDVRVIRWDQRGCGRSDRHGPYSLDQSAADLDAIRTHLGLSQMAVLGHSWGATLAPGWTRPPSSPRHSGASCIDRLDQEDDD
ncbi:MAG: alpha/beta fold hydrolase [Actinomycetota bacterium]|nr:alpha/beta fold hydrolase [Actinomycetota bacterium]